MSVYINCIAKKMDQKLEKGGHQESYRKRQPFKRHVVTAASKLQITHYLLVSSGQPHLLGCSGFTMTLLWLSDFPCSAGSTGSGAAPSEREAAPYSLGPE